MADRANVTSVEAIEAFRSNLILYVSKARPAVEEVTADVMRLKVWLQSDQRLRWESQLRQRTKDLERVQGELSSARMSSLPTDQAAKVLAVRRAKAAVEEAEAKLKRIKQWSREIDQRLDPLTRQLEKLQAVIACDMPLANAALVRTVQTLAAYAEVGSPSGSPPATPSPTPAAGETPSAAPGAPGASPAPEPPGSSATPPDE